MREWINVAKNKNTARANTNNDDQKQMTAMMERQSASISSMSQKMSEYIGFMTKRDDSMKIFTNTLKEQYQRNRDFHAQQNERKIDLLNKIHEQLCSFNKRKLPSKEEPSTSSVAKVDKSFKGVFGDSVELQSIIDTNRKIRLH